MKRGRLALFAFLICLPALLIVGVGSWLILTEIPRAIRNEPRRIGREYREIAENLSRHPEQKTYEGERRKGWQQAGKIEGFPWGYATAGEVTTVWCGLPDKRCRGVAVPTIRPFPYALVFYVGGAAVAVTLLGLSGFALLCFLRFMRERDDFLAATAHDLTTPLVGMRMTIGRDDDEAKRLNERMLVIVNNIRDYLKLGGRRKPTLTPCDVISLCREAYALFAADYEDSESGPVTFADPDLQPRPLVLADETMTMQILWNLFGNDLKYAAPYGKVEVRFSADGRNVTVAFADEGPGMSVRQMRKAFDRYYRAKTVLKSGKGGFGIGLCTAREFARAMGGDLTVRANAPHGCIFALSLPSA